MPRNTAFLCTPDPGSLLCAPQAYREGLDWCLPSPSGPQLSSDSQQRCSHPEERHRGGAPTAAFQYQGKVGASVLEGNLHSRHIPRASHAPELKREGREEADGHPALFACSASIPYPTAHKRRHTHTLPLSLSPHPV